MLQAEIGAGAAPALTTTSPSAKGAARSWTKVDDFTQEVGNARIYEGVHYRFSTEAGTAMGKQIGELAVAKVLRTPAVSAALASPATGDIVRRIGARQGEVQEH